MASTYRKVNLVLDYLNLLEEYKDVFEDEAMDDNVVSMLINRGQTMPLARLFNFNYDHQKAFIGEFQELTRLENQMKINGVQRPGRRNIVRLALMEKESVESIGDRGQESMKRGQSARDRYQEFVTRGHLATRDGYQESLTRGQPTRDGYQEAMIRGQSTRDKYQESMTSSQSESSSDEDSIYRREYTLRSRTTTEKSVQSVISRPQRVLKKTTFYTVRVQERKFRKVSIIRQKETQSYARKQSGLPKLQYRKEELQSMIDYILQNKKYRQGGSLKMWKEAKRTGYFPNRTACALLQKFLKKILPNLDQFKVTPAQKLLLQKKRRTS